MNKAWIFESSAPDVTGVVEAVARSKASLVTIASGPALVAAIDAAGLGLLRSVGDGVFEMTQCGRRAVTQKDPGGYVMNYVAIKASCTPKDDDLLRLKF